jgi:4-carboxymuconolactone decarboxylase
MKDKLLEKGLKVRKEVLGADYVNKQISQADDFSLPMQELATKAAWGLVWTRPGLSRKARSMINIAMLVAMGKAEELELHIAGALQNGVTKKEIQEILIHTSMYCGFPAALGGFRIARNYFTKQRDTPRVVNKSKRVKRKV